MPEAPARNPLESFTNAVSAMIDGPVTWFRGKFRYFEETSIFLMRSALLELLGLLCI